MCYKCCFRRPLNANVHRIMDIFSPLWNLMSVAKCDLHSANPQKSLWHNCGTLTFISMPHETQSLPRTCHEHQCHMIYLSSHPFKLGNRSRDPNTHIPLAFYVVLPMCIKCCAQVTHRIPSGLSSPRWCQGPAKPPWKASMQVTSGVQNCLDHQLYKVYPCISSFTKDIWILNSKLSGYLKLIRVSWV